MQSDIDLNRLKIFQEVVMAGSFSKAALNLRQAKSRVSRNIAALEEEIGIRLIHRTTRQFQLTTAGQELFQNAGPLLSQLTSTLDHIKSTSEDLTGSIRLSVPDDIGVSLMGRVCQNFLAVHPKIRIDLHVGNEIVDLIQDSFDLVVRVGKSSDSTLIQKKVANVGLQFYASPTLLSRYRPLKEIDDLLELPYLAFRSQHTRAHSIKLRKGQEQHSLAIKPSFSTNNFFVLREMALQDGGVTTLPPFIANDYVRTGALISLLSSWQTEGGPIKILMPKQNDPPLRIKRFVEYLSDNLKSYLE